MGENINAIEKNTKLCWRLKGRLV